MDGYCDINKDLTSETIPKDLDQMARQINASKCAKSNDIYRAYRTECTLMKSINGCDIYIVSLYKYKNNGKV